MADLRKLITSIDKMNESVAPVAKTVIAEGSMLKALNMVTKSVAPAAELAKEYKIFKEAAKWRADDLEDKVWTRDKETGERIPMGGNDGYPGDELTGRPGAWGGKYKRMTKKGKPTQQEIGMQNNTKMRMKTQAKNGGLTGPKGPLPESAMSMQPGDKVTWFHSNHFPEIEGTVVGLKDGWYIVQSIDPNPRNTEKTVTKYRVPKNNILSHNKQDMAESALNESGNVIQSDVDANTLHREIAEVMKDIAAEHQQHATAGHTKGGGAAPDSTKFNTVLYGMIEYAPNTQIHGYGGMASVYRDFLKLGAKVPSQVKQKIQSDFEYELQGMVGQDVPVGSTIITTDGYRFFYSVTGGTAWTGFGFQIAKPAAGWQPSTTESITEDGTGEPDVDQILQYLTSAYRHLQQYADQYQDFGVITRIYDNLRYDLKAGNYDAFQKTYENCLSRYPDASVELFDAMFVEAGLPEEQGTIEQFLEKCSGMQEGYDDEEHPIRDDGNEGRPGKARYPGTATEGIGDTIKRGAKYVKRYAQGWTNDDLPITGKANSPKDVVKRNKGYDDETLTRMSKAVNGPGPGFPFRKGDLEGSDKHSPAGLQKRVVDREMKKRGLGESFGVFHRMSEGVAPIKTFALKEDAMAMAKCYNKINREEGVRYVVRNIAEAMPAAVATATTKMNPAANAAPTPATGAPNSPGASAPKAPGGAPTAVDPAVAKAQQAAYQKNIAKLGIKGVNPAQTGVAMQKQADDMQLSPTDNTNNAKIAGTLVNVLKDPSGAQQLKTLTDKFAKKPGQV